MSKADIVNMLANFGSGQSIHHINDAIGEVVTSVMETGKAGEFTLTLKFTKNGDIGLKVDDVFKTKIPQPATGSTLFFVDEHGNMLRRDPRQGELFRDSRRKREEAEAAEETAAG